MIVLLQQPLDVRLPVQDLPAKLDIGNPSLVPVILQAPAADLQHPGKLPVGQEPFPVEGRTVVTGKAADSLRFDADGVGGGDQTDRIGVWPYRGFLLLLSSVRIVNSGISQ